MSGLLFVESRVRLNMRWSSTTKTYQHREQLLAPEATITNFRVGEETFLGEGQYFLGHHQVTYSAITGGGY